MKSAAGLRGERDIGDNACTLERNVDAMTNEEHIALLRRALKGMLTLVSDDSTIDVRSGDPRIVEARRAISETGDPPATAPIVTLFEAHVVDEEGDYSSRHFAWTEAEAVSAAARQVEDLISEANRGPSDVYSDGVCVHTIAFTKAGVLEFLNEHFSGLCWA